MRSTFTKLAVAGGLVGLGFALAPAGAQAQDADPVPPAEAPVSVPCVVTHTSVRGADATLDVGPANCNVPVGPISFSAYDLPGGQRVPYDAQKLIAHHGNNGATYTAGSYALSLNFAFPCNWQTDLYRGTSESVPSFGDRLFNSDWVEGQVCVEETTPTTIAVEVAETTPTTIASAAGGPTTTAVAGDGGDTTTTTAVASAGPTGPAAPVAPSGAVAGGSGSTARANPAATALPATGPTETLIFGLLGGTLIGLGTLARRVARS